MVANKPVVWGIHAGRTGDADTLFLKKNYIALGWPELGDLASLPDREAFKARMAAKQMYQSKPGAIPVAAGQLFRFVHEMKAGDLVVYPSQANRQIHIGRVAGPYAHEPGIDQAYPNMRSIEWLRTLPRTDFSQGALYEIGSAMSLFQVKNYADEFRSVLEGKTAPTPVDKDETVGLVAKDVEETTRDFILKQLAQEFKGHPLAGFVAHLLGTMGYKTKVSPPGADGGIDIIAHKGDLGFEPPFIKVQVKSTAGSVGAPEVQALWGLIGTGEYGLLVTLGTYTKQARTFAEGKSHLRLVDGLELVDLVLQHYEQFDARHKSLLPLKRVYIPEPLDDEQ